MARGHASARAASGRRKRLVSLTPPCSTTKAAIRIITCTSPPDQPQPVGCRPDGHHVSCQGMPGPQKAHAPTRTQAFARPCRRKTMDPRLWPQGRHDCPERSDINRNWNIRSTGTSLRRARPGGLQWPVFTATAKSSCCGPIKGRRRRRGDRRPSTKGAELA